MRKFMVMAGLVAVAIACATGADMAGDSGLPDAGAQPTPKPGGKFVGYTSEAHSLSPFDEGGGLFNIYAACQSDFGTTARICTVTDVLGTPDLPAPPPGKSIAVAHPANPPPVAEGAWLIANNLDRTPGCWGGVGGGPTAYLLTGQGSIVPNQSCSLRRVLACCTTN